MELSGPRVEDSGAAAGAPGFDASAFRRALGHFPTGVTVITAASPEDGLIGITVSSFNSVSLDPPLILFSVAKECRSLHALSRASAYAVNVLRQDQDEISRRFARAMSAKWADVRYRRGVSASPILESALAVFECEPYAQHDAGDHEIFVGRVINIDCDVRGQPLVFFRGAYGTLDSAAQVAEP